MSDLTSTHPEQHAPPQATEAPATAPATPSKARLSPARRRRRVRRVIKSVTWVLVLCALSAGGWRYYASLPKADEDGDAIQYAQAVAWQGEMVVSVYGSGSIAAASQPTVYVQTEGQLLDLRADVGDEVKKGQILAVLKNDELDDEITSLEYDLWEADGNITSTYAGSEVRNIQAPSSGRVMELSAKVGDDALAIYRRLGSVAMLSTDGRMKVPIEVAEGVSLSYGDEVVVLGDGFGIEGTVADLFLQGTRAVITILDDTLPLHAPVIVTTVDDVKIGEGKLEINKPMAVSAFGGTIKAVRVKVGDKVDRRDTLFSLEDSPIPLKVENLLIQREAAATSLSDARSRRENLIVRAPVAGVVASVEAEEGADMASGDALCSILEGEEMVLTIAVDELDVVKVAENQRVDISVDALPDLELTGTVRKIAPTGSGESGVATYDVKLNFDSAGTGVRPGMNASGQIQVARADNALYIPVEALMTMNGERYVMVADDGFGPQNGGEGTAPTLNARDGGGFGAAGGTGTTGGRSGFDPSSMSGEELAALRQARTGGRGSNESAPSQPGGGAAAPQGFAARPAGDGQQQPALTGSLRAVTVGLVNDDHAEILSGLSVGEVVLYQNAGNNGGGRNSFMIRTGGAMPMMGF